MNHTVLASQAFCSYDHISQEFSKYHTKPLNVMLHFLTTPLGILGFFSIIRSYTKSSSAMFTLTSVYLMSLLPVLPSGEFIGTAILCGILLVVSSHLQLRYWLAIVCIVAGYLLQDLAHLGTGEATFQSSYSEGGQVTSY
jgi:hypothetical protein